MTKKGTKKLYLTITLLLVLFISVLIAVLALGFYQSPSVASSQPELASTQVNKETTMIHRYESPLMDSVNLYWLETDKGIIIIDTGRFLSQARYALEEIQTSSNKPIVGILITHPHTDHYGGLPVFAKAAGKNVPIYASQITYDDIKTDGQGFISLRNKLHGNDFPDQNEIPLPNHIIKNGDEIRLGGLTLRTIELPNNETLVTTLYFLDEQNSLFAGDIVTDRSIPFLADGYSSNWLAQLRMLLEQYPNKTLYPGHGKPGLARSLIEAQIEYIEFIRSLVADALISDNLVTSEEKAKIVAQMEAKYPDYETSLVLPGILERGVDGIAKEMKQGSS